MTGRDQKPTIFIVSGGVGASGEQLVRTALAQFEPDTVEVITAGNIRQPEQIAEVLKQAQKNDGLVVHTLIDLSLKDYLVSEAERMQVQAIDAMGPLLAWISQKVGAQPKGQPGLYRLLNRPYFDRIAAIDYAMAHDDGKNPDGWGQAEAFLVGVSRVGKTPLSIYLAVLGWKVANYPLVPQVRLPEALFTLDPNRVFGLTIEPGQLLHYRMRRQRALGAPVASQYVDPQSVYEELEEAKKVFRRGKFKIIDMTDKTIEMGADEIIRHLTKESSAGVF